MNRLLRATGAHRYSRKHLRDDRDAAVRRAAYLEGRLERSAQANRELAEKRDAALAENRGLKQQAEVTNALVSKVQVQIRDLKVQVAELASDKPDWPVPKWAASSETTQNIPMDQLPQPA